jgi:predicted phage terminase large subunit-like protein
MQRSHEQDISGHILANDLGYTHVCLPAEYETKHPFLFMGDMRSKEGELLWPDHYGPDQVGKLKKGLTERAVAGQLQQRPSLAEGTYFKREWFRWYEQEPQHLRVYGASDYAVTDKGGDWTVHLVVGIDPDDNIYILDLWRDQTVSDVWVEAFIDLGLKHKPLIWGEEKGQIIKSLGPYIDKRMKKRRAYFRREQFASVADKPTRCRAFQASASQGKIYLPKDTPWVDELINELLMFPGGAYDDQVDALSLIGQMLDAMIGGTIPVNKNSNTSGYSSKKGSSNSWKLA